MTVDLTGVAVTNVRDWPSVAAITTRVRGGELAPNDAPPAVVIFQLSNTFSPFGNTHRARLQQPLFAALCYGTTKEQAAQLMGAVVDAVNLRGPRKDSSGRYVALSLVEGGGDIVLDPTTSWPVATVTFTFTGAAQAVA